MISVIVCTRHKTPEETFVRCVADTIGCEHELICIDNSENTHSIASAYARGIAASRYPLLCFVHDDVEFLTPGWGEIVRTQLNRDKVGLIGLAGGDAALRTLFDYGSVMRSTYIIHQDKAHHTAPETVCWPVGFSEPSRRVVLLDGVWLCGRRSLFEHIRFDDSVGRFHGYDYDISLQATDAGFYNYVIYDLQLIHHSKGNFDARYYHSLMQVASKWSDKLPLYREDVALYQQEAYRTKQEKKALRKLLKRLARTGLTCNDGVRIYNFYLRFSGIWYAAWWRPFSAVRFLLIKLLWALRKKEE